MKRAYTPLKWAMAGAIVVAALAIPGLPASAQEATSSTSPAAPKRPRTTATPEMIDDAIERSKSRTERFKATGVPERFGSEDPVRFKTTK